MGAIRSTFEKAHGHRLSLVVDATTRMRASATRVSWSQSRARLRTSWSRRSCARRS